MPIPSSRMSALERTIRAKAAAKGIRMSDLQRVTGRTRSVFNRVIRGKAQSRPLLRAIEHVLECTLNG